MVLRCVVFVTWYFVTWYFVIWYLVFKLGETDPATGAAILKLFHSHCRCLEQFTKKLDDKAFEVNHHYHSITTCSSQYPQSLRCIQINIRTGQAVSEQCSLGMARAIFGIPPKAARLIFRWWNSKNGRVVSELAED